MRTRPVLIAAVVTGILALCGCKEHVQPLQPQGQEDLFARWFVNPTKARLDSLIALGLSCTQVDEMAQRIRTGSGTYQAGTTSITLTDTAGSPYVLGFKTPATIDPSRTYPLIVYLHGGIGTTFINKGDSAWAMLAPLADSIDLFLASPSANRFTPWWSPAGLSRIMQTVRYLSLHYPIDPDRVILAGVSDGATGCFAVANTIPHPFAGFIAVSGLGAMLEQFGLPLAPGNLRQRPFYVINAGKDHLYPIKYATAFLDTLEKQGVNIKRKIYPNEKHGFDYREKEMGTLAGLVRSWVRPRDRRGVNWTFINGFPVSPDNILGAGFPEQSITQPVLAGSWSDNLLSVKAVGTAWFVYAPADDHGTAITVRINDTRMTQAPAIENDPSLMFAAILHDAFPFTQCRHYYKVTVQE